MKMERGSHGFIGFTRIKIFRINENLRQSRHLHVNKVFLITHWIFLEIRVNLCHPYHPRAITYYKENNNLQRCLKKRH